MASDALWIVSFKCVVKGYQKCRFDVKDGEVFKVLKKIGETGRAFRIANEHGQLGHLRSVLFCSLKCRGQFINEVSVIRINCKKAEEKPVLMGLLWGCFGLALYRFTRANRTQSI